MLPVFAKNSLNLLPYPVRSRIRAFIGRIQVKNWESKGRPMPPPHYLKQQTIKYYQSKYHLKMFIETGTSYGDMIEALKRNFDQLYSIELGKDLWKRAVKRFRNDANVTILQGDSGKVLEKITCDLSEPAIFWLDGHYSGGVTAKGDKECPILEEVNAIFKFKNIAHILLVDDARSFDGQHDYPTIEELTNHIKAKNNKYEVVVKDDIIRYVVADED
jgi:hypothetical protein